ncbi:hypothetical protein HPP92_014237 [Vanilla planifolia]|uniref:Uncharacterized protein n=1 Tax=Vanilla planifolia TaxID=51239 RepID=A0A835UWP1_VANPL|nr:hypothetical protein HPP92_014237 [Vanilla planifolia]
MEKLLAMSILSASPAEIAGFWKNLQLKGKKQSASNKAAGEAEHRSGRSKGEKACFAPEFDGLHCFETLVSH